MGRTSSKPTSSKTKSSKLYSEARKKKKNRISKSKKLRDRKDYSSCSRDDSRSLASISSSSSEDEHYKSRSRRKSELKKSKKRARERSSTKSDKVSKIKKPHKKKLRREPSFTSLSSDSRSSSANSVPSDTKKKLRKKRRKRESSIASISSDFNSDETREVESRRGTFREKSEGGRDLGKTKSLKVRSRSCSPYDRYDDVIDNSVPIFPAENNSRRLRSVITVLRPREYEEREWKGDRDNKRDLENCSHINNETRDAEILNRDKDFVSDFKLSEVIGGGDGEVNTVGNENMRDEVSPVLPNTENDLESMLRLKALENMIKFKGAQIEKLKAPIKLCNSNVEEQDQKEKLKVPTKLDSSNVKEQSRIPVTIKSEPVSVSKKTGKVNSAVGKNVVKKNLEITSESVPNSSKNGGVLKSSVSEMGIVPKKTQIVNPLRSESNVDNKSALTLEKDGQARKYVERNIVLKSSVSETVTVPKNTQNANSLLFESNVDDKSALTSEKAEQAGKNVERNIVLKSSVSELVNIPKKTISVISLLAESIVDDKAALTSEEVGHARKNVEQDIILESSVAESAENDTLKPASPEQASKKKDQDKNVLKSSISELSSSLKPALEENSSKEHQSTGNESSQFEQKTMSVMRGGEMVQVSYKVYIPKKAPALARRPIRR